MEVTEIKYFIEAALLAAARPMNLDQIGALFDEASAPDKKQLREAIEALQEEYEPRGIEIAEVASGFRMQVNSSMAERLGKLWEERPPRYSRALFETLALIAYRQPMTRGEIEEVRGVSVSPNIIRTLLEREWVRVVGHRDVPGRPAMFGTTKGFLDYFGLKKLDDLPPLADLADWESLRVQLNLPAVNEEESGNNEDETSGDGATVTQLPVAPRAGGDEADEDDESTDEADAVAIDGDQSVTEQADEPDAADVAESDDGAADSAVEVTSESADTTESADEADDAGDDGEEAAADSSHTARNA